MANNPYVNKVEYAGQTLMDLTGDTVDPPSVLNGVTFHDRSGAPQTGSMITHSVYDGLDSTSTSDALSANQGRVLNSKIPNIFTYAIGSVTTDAAGMFALSNYTAPWSYVVIGVFRAVGGNSPYCFIPAGHTSNVNTVKVVNRGDMSPVANTTISDVRLIMLGL